MTTGEVRESVAAVAPARSPAVSGLLGAARLAYLYLISRRIPMAIALLAGTAALLWSALYWHWNIAGGAAAKQFFPAAIETMAAMIVAVTTYGPFGEPERATGRWLPYLRLGMAVALSAIALGLLAAGTTAGQVPGGMREILRNFGGVAGIGLLAAAVFGGQAAWVPPMAYFVIAEAALAARWATPWVWPARPPGDRGAAVCAGLVFAAGIAIITVRGARPAPPGDTS